MTSRQIRVTESEEGDAIIVRIIISLDSKHNFITHLYLRAFATFSEYIFEHQNSNVAISFVLSHFNFPSHPRDVRIFLSRSDMQRLLHMPSRSFSLWSLRLSTWNEWAKEREEKPIIVFSLEFHYPFTRA